MLYLSAIILAFFLSFVLLTKKRKSTADFILVIWLAVIGLHLLSFYVFSTDAALRYPITFVLAFPLPLLHGPLLYLYTINQTRGGTFKPIQLLHFVPVLLCWLLFEKYFALPTDQQIEVIRQKGVSFEWQVAVNRYAAWLSGLVYVSLSFYQLRSYRRSIVDEFSNTEKINFNWLMYLTFGMVIIWGIVIFVQQDAFIFTSAAFFVGWIAYFGIKQVQVFSQHSSPPISRQSEPTTQEESQQVVPEEPKSQRPLLTDTEATDIQERLLSLLQREQPYKDPDLTLTTLARTLSVHPNTLSRVINDREKKNFYDLVNEKRVAEFIRLSALPNSQQYTLISLAFDCGFNSKASFNRNFKKHTGQTPSEFVKQKATSAKVSFPM